MKISDYWKYKLILVENRRIIQVSDPKVFSGILKDQVKQTILKIL